MFSYLIKRIVFLLVTSSALADTGPIVDVYLERSNATHEKIANDLADVYSNFRWRPVAVGGAPFQTSGDRRPPSLVVTLGENALREAIPANSTVPILAVLVSAAQFDQIVPKDSKQRASAIFSDPNPVLQLALAKSLFGTRQAYGVIVHKEQTVLKHTLQTAAQSLDIHLTFYEYRDGDQVLQIVGDMPQRQPLVAIPDNRIYNAENFRQLILVCYQRDIPIVGYTAGMVKAGTVGTITHDLHAYVTEIKQYIANYFLGYRRPSLQYARNYSIEMNGALAHSLNLPTISRAEIDATLMAEAAKRLPEPDRAVTRR